MVLWLMQVQPTLQLAEETKEIEHKVYTKYGTESVYLPCGELTENVIGIEWFLYKSKQLKKILKFYPNASGSSPRYYNNYTAENYGFNASVKNSLVIKSIEPSNIDWFVCSTVGTDVHYNHTIILQIVGKSLLTYLVLGVVCQHMFI